MDGGLNTGPEKGIIQPKMGEETRTFSDLEAVVERFAFLIRTAIRKTCPSIGGADMADIEQEIKIKIWKEISRSEKIIHNLGSYIWRVAYTTTSRMMKEWSRERKTVRLGVDDGSERPIEPPASKADLPDDCYEKKELSEIVRDSVECLIDSRRQVVKLYLAGMSCEEITEFFGWTEGKARNLLSRGLADLKDKLREKGIGLDPR